MKDAIIHAPFVHRTTKNLTPDDTSLIEAAEMPLKEPVSDALLWDTRSQILQNRKVLIQGVCIALVVMIAGILLGAYKYAFAIGVTAVVCAVAAIILHRNSKIDESATMMRIPIHHTTNNLIGNYAVCYLPDGKYEFRLSGDSSFANSLIVVQYKRMTTWQAVNHVEEAAPSTLGLDDEPEEPEEPAEAQDNAPAAEEPENSDTESSGAAEQEHEG